MSWCQKDRANLKEGSKPPHIPTLVHTEKYFLAGLNGNIDSLIYLSALLTVYFASCLIVMFISGHSSTYTE